MKLALVLMFKDGELPYLRLHLPTTSESFDGIVAITDPRCTDGGLEFMRNIGADVIVEPWTYNWGEFATKVFNYAEGLGYQAAMRVDPDECLMPDAGHEIKRLLEQEATLLCFPRYEFFGSRRRVRGDLYPDHQARAWRLNRGIVVQGKRHEGIDFTTHQIFEGDHPPEKRVLRVSEPHIYHYGYVGRTGIWANMLKYVQHAHVTAGLPPPDSIPADTPLVDFPTVGFLDEQPLDPNIVGLVAPFKD